MIPNESRPPDRPDPVTLHVCTTCRAPADAGGADPGARPGAVLLAALEAELAGAEDVRLVAVECLSVCRRPCTVAAVSSGRWTYVWGDLDPATAAPALLDGVRRYAATPDGIVPWRERPEILRRGVVARVPPLPASLPAPLVVTLPEAAE